MISPEIMVHTDSDHTLHKDLYKTLVLLSLDLKKGTAYFVVEGLSIFQEDTESSEPDDAYFYEEHTCPTNFIRIPMISFEGNDDPHGLFDYVRSIWMTIDYLKAEEEGEEKEYLKRVFPELTDDNSI